MKDLRQEPQKEDIDFGKTATDYALHRAGFPESFFVKLIALNILGKNSRILDLGTGTGTIARGLAQRGMVMTGLDPAAALIEESKKLDAQAGVQVRYLVARAENTSLPSASFDAITAGQCWHWFDHDAVENEAARLLRPAGLLIPAYFDWIEVPDGPLALMYELRKKYNPSWKSTWPLGFYPSGPDDLQFQQFRKLASFSYDEVISYSHIGWRGRMRAYAGIGGSLPKSVVEEFDREFATELKRLFPEEPLQIPHRVWAAVWEKA